jgi:hypothetical protein
MAPERPGRRDQVPGTGDDAKGDAPMKLSARSLLKDQVVEVKQGAVAAQVRVDVGGGYPLASMVMRSRTSASAGRPGPGGSRPRSWSQFSPTRDSALSG